MTLLAGACTRDVTPREPVFLVGYPHVERMSTGVHDPLTVSTVVLGNGAERCVVSSVDLLFISPQTARAVREAVASRLGLGRESVFVACTHTHSGPVTNEVLAWRDDPLVGPPEPAYMSRLVAEIVSSAEEAASRLEPAEIACGSARTSGVGGNRLDPRGPADPDAGFAFVRATRDGSPIACVLSFAMHPTVLHEDSRLVSADFPWATRAHLASALGSGLTTVYLTGTSGNQSPRHVVAANTFAEAERLGTRLGQFVLEAVRALPSGAFTASAAIASATREVALPRRRFPSPEEADRLLGACRRSYESLRHARAPRPEVRTAECAVFGAEETVTLARAQASGALDAWLAAYSPAMVQVLRVGPFSLVGLPGELFVEYGLALKRSAPTSTLVASLVNGDLQGYIVTDEAVRAGTYEALLSAFEPAAGALLVDAALDLLRA